MGKDREPEGLFFSPFALLWAFQPPLGQPILHGSELFMHPWDSLSCMAVSFSSISGRVYPAWQSAVQASLEEPTLQGSELFKHLWKSLSCMAVSFSSISGRVYPTWGSAFQASLEESTLHGSELFKESILHASDLFKHLWKSLSCMAVSF